MKTAFLLLCTYPVGIYPALNINSWRLIMYCESCGKGRAIAGLILSSVTLLTSVYYGLMLVADSSYSY